MHFCRMIWNRFNVGWKTGLGPLLGLFLSLGWGQESLAKTFVIGTLQNSEQVYPLRQMAGENQTIRQLLNPPILFMRADGRISCVLCKEIPDIEVRKEDEGSEPVFVLTLELKKKLKWGDGTPITPQDVKFTLETMAKTDYPRGKGPILPIRRIEIDPEQKNKIKLILTHRRSDAFQLFSIGLLPAHKADLLQKLQKDPHDAAWWSKWQDPGLYYGAYVIKSATVDRWQLASNGEGSWANAPTKDLEVRFLNGLPALSKALQNGELDQTADGELSWLNLLELKSQIPDLEQRFSVQSRPGTTLELILFNMHSPVLVNPQMRQVLHHAMQRSVLVDKVLHGHGAASLALLHPSQLERLGEKVQDPYQPQRVLQLLDQTGAKKLADGGMSIDGQKLNLVLNCSDARLKSGLYQPILEDFRKAGIEVKIESVSEDEFMRQTLAHRRFKDMACMRWQLPPLSAPINLMHSLAIPSSENNYVGHNFSGWDQGIVDRILESMLREADMQQIQRLFSRLDKQFMSELPAIPLVYLPEIWLNRKDENKDIQETQERISLYPATPETLIRRKM